MRRFASALTLLTALLVTLPPALAQADDPDAYGDDYQKGDYGRVRHVENGATVVRAQADDRDRPGNDDVTVNAPVFPGDVLKTARGQRVEVQLAAGTLIRQDDGGETTFVSLPSPGAKYQDNTVLKLALGALRIVARVREEESFRIDTPSASIYVLGDADVRVDVDSAGSTRVLSHRGVVEVVGDGGSVLVRGGMRASVEPGSVPSDPRAFNTFASDGFDRWCDQREDAYRVRDRYAATRDDDVYDEVPYEVRPYYRELSSYGRWVNAPGYGLVWYPYDVAAGWRPYYDGYWDYGPGGYFWVANEPWGWAPYHYGRWSWVVGFGWCWAPGRIFGGAWVSWSWGSAYVGWAPLDFWGRPAYIGHVWYDYYDPGCWSFVGYNHFGYRDYRHHVVPFDRVGAHLRGSAVVTRPPRISPRRLAGDESVRERAFREAERDRGAHLRPIGSDRAPGTKFRTQEDRWIERGRGGAKDGGVPRDSRPVAPRLRREGATPGNLGTRGTERREVLDRSSAPAGGRESGARPSRVPPGAGVERGRTPSNGEPEPYRWQRSRRSDAAEPAPGTGDGVRDRSRSSDGGYPRRILTDPRAEERGRESRRQVESPSVAPRADRDPRSAFPRTEAAPREEPGRDTRERVRNMYRQLARPRETDRRDGSTEVRPSAPSRERGEVRVPRVDKPAPQRRPEAPSVERSRPKSPPASRGGDGGGHSRPKERDRKR